MDPLRNFYDIHEIIIQHFDFQEIFSFYKVSKLWCELVLEKSKFAMKCIRLNVNESNHDEISNILQHKTSEINEGLLDLLNTKRKYQNVKINVDHGWDFIDQLIRNLSCNLIDVEVCSDIYVEDLKIPTLRYLKLDNPLMDGLLTCSNELRKLTISVTANEYWQKKESPKAVRSALKRNSMLEYLEMDAVLTEMIFAENITNIANLKLIELLIKCTKNFSEEHFSNIRNFLSNQRETLKMLDIEFPDIFTLQYIYEQLEHLKVFKSQIHFEDNPQFFELSLNSNIVELEIDIIAKWCFTMNALRKFISCTPNLEIFVSKMRAPLEIFDFRFLLFNAHKLKVFKQNFSDSLKNFTEIYEQMLQDHENISPCVKFIDLS
jgi:hypothetical protein